MKKKDSSSSEEQTEKQEFSLKTIIEAIHPLEQDQKQSAHENLRTEYQAVSDYSIHYSNVRVMLSTFFISIAFLILINQFTAENPYREIFIAGLCVMLFGYFLNLVLTFLMHKSLRRLLQIEIILNSTAGKTSSIPDLMYYFSNWAKNLKRKNALWKAFSEMLSVCYIVIVCIYLVFFFLGLNTLCFQ